MLQYLVEVCYVKITSTFMSSNYLVINEYVIIIAVHVIILAI